MEKLLEPAKAWWSSISQREQRLVIVCSVVFAVYLIYSAILQPLSDASQTAHMRISSDRELLTWVKEKADQITELRAQSGVATSSQTLNQIISSSTRRFNIELIRVQPNGDMLQVWTQPLPFKQFVSWLDYLSEKQGVNVAFMDVAKTDTPGVIQINRLQFKRG
ncbi:type II secretion system protein M [Vibrio sp. S4M6]|uniref:type II secretion system protein M n=1 Tax=Vibrio sinus TaxID=2946865 RepID=UPI00202A959B|nr:type II secretion system protein M [Vibrio sinus]MCL9780319.1 type II secretion system protein M [Vibrio sinus]